MGKPRREPACTAAALADPPLRDRHLAVRDRAAGRGRVPPLLNGRRRVLDDAGGLDVAGRLDHHRRDRHRLAGARVAFAPVDATSPRSLDGPAGNGEPHPRSSRLLKRRIAAVIITVVNKSSANTSGQRSTRYAPRSMIPRNRRTKWVRGSTSASHRTTPGQHATGNLKPNTEHDVK